MFCKNCGNEIKDGVKFCAKCGARLHTASEIKESLSSDNISSDVTGHRYRFRCCVEAHGRIPIIALPLIYFLGDSVDFIFQENTIKIYSSKWDIEEPYENINNIYFQDNVPFRRNFPIIFSILIAALILCCGEFDFIVIIGIILTLGLGIFLKFGKKKRTAIIVEYKDGKNLCIPMKKLKEKQLHLKEQFLKDINHIKR